MNPGMQNFTGLVQVEHFQIRGWMDWVRQMCVFQRKTGHISETVKDTAKVIINH